MVTSSPRSKTPSAMASTTAAGLPQGGLDVLDENSGATQQHGVQLTCVGFLRPDGDHQDVVAKHRGVEDRGPCPGRTDNDVPQPQGPCGRRGRTAATETAEVRRVVSAVPSSAARSVTVSWSRNR